MYIKVQQSNAPLALLQKDGSVWEEEEEVWSFMLGLPPQHEEVGGTSAAPLLPAHVSWHQSVLAVLLCLTSGSKL